MAEIRLGELLAELPHVLRIGENAGQVGHVDGPKTYNQQGRDPAPDQDIHQTRAQRPDRGLERGRRESGRGHGLSVADGALGPRRASTSARAFWAAAILAGSFEALASRKALESIMARTESR